MHFGSLAARHQTLVLTLPVAAEDRPGGRQKPQLVPQGSWFTGREGTLPTPPFNTMKVLVSLFSPVSMSTCHKASEVRALRCIDPWDITKYNPFHFPIVSSLLLLLHSKRVRTYRAKLFCWTWNVSVTSQVLSKKPQNSAPLRLMDNAHQQEDKDKIWVWSFNVRFW